MEKHLTSLVISEMWKENHYTPTKWLQWRDKIKKQNKKCMPENMEFLVLLQCASKSVNWYKHFGKINWLY